MGKRYLLDTSTIIKYLNGTLPERGIELLDNLLDEESCISFITEIELQVWNPTNSADLKVYEEFVKYSNILSLTQGIIEETITIRKKYHIKLPDALIAASAIQNKRVLVADNNKDFKKIVGLKVLNPIHENDR